MPSSANEIPILLLEDLKDWSIAQVVDLIINKFEGRLEPYQILIAAVTGLDYYDSYAWFLLSDPSGELFEVNASHCSCYEYEGQFKPEKTTRGYLKSEHFSCLGQEHSRVNPQILDFINTHL